MLSIIEPDYHSTAWEALPGDCRKRVMRLLAAFRECPQKGRTQWMRGQAENFGMSYQSFRGKFYDILNNGGDWTILIDKRQVKQMRAATSLTRQLSFAAELVRLVEKHQRKNTPAFRTLRRRWQERKAVIPGYESWPGWPQIPAGWSDANLSRIVRDHSNLARLQSIRVGTSSKTNTYLPHVLTTRVGLWPGAVIQLDDQWHDNLVTLGRKKELVRVIELGALDVFSAHRFHWGAKPRRRRENGSWETISAKDMRLFLAGMLHRFGHSPRGTMFMSEHNTAKIDEDIARTLYDATRGIVRVEYQPIEGKQAALCGFWNGTEGGNFRAKAHLESVHNLIRNDMASLPMQTGSFSSGIQGPVTTDRQVAYITRIMRDVLAKVPERAHLLRLPTLDFHTEFIPYITDYYLFGLATRTDHDLEGWERLGHVVTEYTALPGSDAYLSCDAFLALPESSQMIIMDAARANPEQWMRRRKLSPVEVWDKREKFTPVAPTVLCDILTEDLAREVTARRGFLEFSDQEIAPDPLVYAARFVSGPHAGREIPHGQKVRMFALPFDDATAIVVDARDRFLGEVPLYKRVVAVDPTAFGSTAPYESRPDIRGTGLIRAAGEKHSRIADILEPSRILHADDVRQARDLRAHNQSVLSGAPVTPAEISDAAAGRRRDKSAIAIGRAIASTRPDLSSAPEASASEEWPESWPEADSHVSGPDAEEWPQPISPDPTTPPTTNEIESW